MPIQSQLLAGAFIRQHRLEPEPRGEDRQVEVLRGTPVLLHPAPFSPHRANPTGQVPLGGGENWWYLLSARRPGCDQSCRRQRSLSGTPADMSWEYGGLESDQFSLDPSPRTGGKAALGTRPLGNVESEKARTPPVALL